MTHWFCIFHFVGIPLFIRFSTLYAVNWLVHCFLGTDDPLLHCHQINSQWMLIIRTSISSWYVNWSGHAHETSYTVYKPNLTQINALIKWNQWLNSLPYFLAYFCKQVMTNLLLQTSTQHQRNHNSLLENLAANQLM